MQPKQTMQWKESCTFNFYVVLQNILAKVYSGDWVVFLFVFFA